MPAERFGALGGQAADLGSARLSLVAAARSVRSSRRRRRYAAARNRSRPQEPTVDYPLEPLGVNDYPVKVGSMLLTMVDPHRGFEHAYNRWYERDHYYAGCMVGPHMFAGSRWVAPGELKNRRWPEGDTSVADPPDAGSYVSIYWVEQGRHSDHFDRWARPQVRWLYESGRGFAERRHIHTVLFDNL